MERQSLELLLAQGESIERIAKRFGKDPSTVSYWCDKYGLASQHAEKYAAKGALDKERLEQLVEAGMSIAQIANQVGRSRGTVRHWLRRYGLKTHKADSKKSGVSRAARQAGLLSTVMTCPRHGETEFVIEARGYYRCKRCRVEAVTRRRRKVKAILVQEAGGCCSVCGYDRHVEALEFHHVDPAEKLYDVSRHGVTMSLEAARMEAAKCVLLCSNCHAEVESGATRLPATVPAWLADP